MEDKIAQYVKRAELLKETLGFLGLIHLLLGKQVTEDSDANKDKSADYGLSDQLKQAIITEKPNIRWEDVAGLDVAKDELMGAVILPSKHPEFFAGKRKPWQGILLYGPPGTGSLVIYFVIIRKVLFSKSCCIPVRQHFYVHLFFGSSKQVARRDGSVGAQGLLHNRLVKTMFNMARQMKPTVIFVDEIDSLCASRDVRVVAMYSTGRQQQQRHDAGAERVPGADGRRGEGPDGHPGAGRHQHRKRAAG